MKSLHTLFYDLVLWSNHTFGNRWERGPVGPLNHLKKEAQEAIEHPEDISEFADLLILVFDAAWRAGHNYASLERAVNEKFALLQTRDYSGPADANGVIEHDRTGETI